MLKQIQKADWCVLNKIRKTCKCRALDFLIPKITALGNGGFIWLAIAAILLFHKKYRVHGFLIFCALMLGATIGNFILKNVIKRPRPCWIKEETQLLIKNPKDFSFPSGHTLSSFIAASILVSTNLPLAIFGLTLATLIAFSRLYLYVHFPSDIIFSMAFGVTLSRVVFAVGMGISASLPI